MNSQLKALHVNLIVLQLVNKFPEFAQNQKFYYHIIGALYLKQMKIILQYFLRKNGSYKHGNGRGEKRIEN
jgi:hypothetical protein